MAEDIVSGRRNRRCCFSFISCFGNSVGEKKLCSLSRWFKSKNSATETAHVDSPTEDLQHKDSGIVFYRKNVIANLKPEKTKKVTYCQPGLMRPGETWFFTPMASFFIVMVVLGLLFTCGRIGAILCTAVLIFSAPKLCCRRKKKRLQGAKD